MLRSFESVQCASPGRGGELIGVYDVHLYICAAADRISTVILRHAVSPSVIAELPVTILAECLLCSS